MNTELLRFEEGSFKKENMIPQFNTKVSAMN